MRRVQAVAPTEWDSTCLCHWEPLRREVHLSFCLKMTGYWVWPWTQCSPKRIWGCIWGNHCQTEMKEGREINDMAEMRLLRLSLEGRSRETRTKQGLTSNPFILNVLGLFCSKPYLLSCPDRPLYNYSYLRGCWIILSSELILLINISLLLNIAIYKNIKPIL